MVDSQSHTWMLVDSDMIVYRLAHALEGRRWNVNGKIFDSKSKANKEADKTGIERDDILYCPEPEDEQVVRSTTRDYCEELMRPFPFYKFTFFISSPGNFRNSVGTIRTYKGNRGEVERPEHYQLVKDILANEYSSIYAHDLLEVDDMLSASQEDDGSTCIVTADKDLWTVPGLHYHLNDRVCSYVSEVESHRNFYAQVLTGDTIDNIPGLFGVGKSSKLVKDIYKMSTEEEMFNFCLEQYTKRFGNYAEQFMIENCKLLYMVRDELPYWLLRLGVNPLYWEET